MTEDSFDEGPPPASSRRVGLKALRAELEQERDRHLRTRADFENYRRRVERDRDVASRQARRDLLLALVDLADGFDRALFTWTSRRTRSLPAFTGCSAG